MTYEVVRRRTSNSQMNDFQVVSRRAVELAIELRAYRNKHQISQRQMAHIASAYGMPFKVKFTQYDISHYEKYLTIPTENKMYALLNMLGITIEMLDE